MCTNKMCEKERWKSDILSKDVDHLRISLHSSNSISIVRVRNKEENQEN